MMTQEILQTAFHIGAWSYIWVAHLLYPGKVLDFGRKWIDRITEVLKPAFPMTWIRKLRFAWYECEACISGQIAIVVALICGYNPFLLFVYSVTIASLIGGLSRGTK